MVFGARTSVAHLNSVTVSAPISLIRIPPEGPDKMFWPCFPALGTPAIIVAITLSVRKNPYGTLSPATPL